MWEFLLLDVNGLNVYGFLTRLEVLLWVNKQEVVHNGNDHQVQQTESCIYGTKSTRTDVASRNCAHSRSRIGTRAGDAIASGVLSLPLIKYFREPIYLEPGRTALSYPGKRA